ncbi:hypothetical protein [Burkholderia contaminans]|uniref:hypothetical protein n=1 Tax=Burkholderia contaminans TaxID=488447 RepID=UPI0013CE9E20|nr:hypothetical protein [Burkholderia contaminans]
MFGEQKAVVLDFSRTMKMYADGTLLFVAELRRLIRETKGAVTVSCDVPKSDKVAQVLKQIRIFELLGTSCNVEPKDDDVTSWRYAHDHRVDGTKYDEVLGAYDGQMADALTTQLYKGITEAMTNVVNHAYIAPRRDGLPVQTDPEWWMFSREMDGTLAIVFCDLGAGIPVTLPVKKPSLWDRIARLGKASDAQVIAHAIQDSISRTKASHRGKGLGQIVKAIDSVPRSEVVVLSNRGGYRRRNGRTNLTHYRDSIMGTMIMWRVPLDGGAA